MANAQKVSQSARNTTKATETKAKASETVKTATLVEPAGNVTSIKTARPNIFTDVASDRNARLAEKADVLKAAKSALETAQSFYDEAGSQDNRASEYADKGALALYQGQTGGLLTQEEVSAVLCDIFGRVPKKDGTPGKTPKGNGATIRKRIVRAVSAREYVETDAVPAFFEGMDKQAVSGVMAETEAGKISIFTAYDLLSKMKSEGNVRIEQAFNPKSIAAINATLSDVKAASEIFLKNEALVETYAALMETLHVVGEMAAKLRNERKAA